jgi:hypothetical protein
MTGAALASAAAIVTASPAILPTHDIAVGSLPVSTAKVALTAITDITIQGINDAYWFGWGGYISCAQVNSSTNSCQTFNQTTQTWVDNGQYPYYPGVSNIFVNGVSGVAYYLTDNVLESLDPSFDLDNYFFEIGLPAVPYVGSGEIFGTTSPVFQAAQTVFHYGIPAVVNSIVASAANLIPPFSLGPIQLGAGTLVSLFFYGQTPDGSFNYGTPGLAAIVSYLVTSISDSLPAAAAAIPSLSGVAGAAAAAVQTVVKDVEGAVKSATSGTAASAAAKSSNKTAAAELKTESTNNTSSTEGTGSSTEGTSSTEGSGSSTDGTPATSKSSGSAAPKTTASPTKPAKPAKPQNPLAKIGKRISDALSGGKKTKSESSSSSDSSSSSSGDSSGSSDSAK